MSSLTESDISQNSDSTSYISFSETDDSLQHSCQSLCGQEGSGEYHLDCPSYHSAPEILSQKEDVPVQSEIPLLQ